MINNKLLICSFQFVNDLNMSKFKIISVLYWQWHNYNTDITYDQIYWMECRTYLHHTR